MHKPHTNVETQKDGSSVDWEFIPYNFHAIDLKPFLFPLIPIVAGGVSGCSGLSAWLQYNENRVRGCIDIPVYSTGAIPPSETAAEPSQEFCLPTSEGGVEPTP